MKVFWKKTIIAGGLIIAALLLLANHMNNPTHEETSYVEVENIRFTVEIADTAFKQARGLSDREKLCDSCGMLFLYDKPQTQNFWMNEMRFPIDIIFVKGDEVVEIWENAQPPVPDGDIPRYQSVSEADKVLEINAGLSRKYQIKPGSVMTLFLNPL